MRPRLHGHRRRRRRAARRHAAALKIDHPFIRPLRFRCTSFMFIVQAQVVVQALFRLRLLEWRERRRKRADSQFCCFYRADANSGEGEQEITKDVPSSMYDVKMKNMP